MSEGESRNGGCLSALFGGLFRPSQADIARAQAYEARAHALEIVHANRAYAYAIAYGLSHADDYHPDLFPTYISAQVIGWMDAVGYEHFPHVHAVRLGESWNIPVAGVGENEVPNVQDFFGMADEIAERYKFLA